MSKLSMYADAGTPLEDGLAEFATAHPVGRNHPDSGHDDAVHVPLPPSIDADSWIAAWDSRPWILYFPSSLR